MDAMRSVCSRVWLRSWDSHSIGGGSKSENKYIKTTTEKYSTEIKEVCKM